MALALWPTVSASSPRASPFRDDHSCPTQTLERARATRPTRRMLGSLDIDQRGTRLPSEHVASERLPHLQRLLLLLALVGHEARAVVAIGFERVVRRAPEAEVLSGVRATPRSLRKRQSKSAENAHQECAAPHPLSARGALSDCGFPCALDELPPVMEAPCPP